MSETLALFLSGGDSTAEGTLSLDEVANAQKPLATLPAGTLLNGRYRIEETLGHGGMGIVYRAVDLLREQTVAIKTIRGQLIEQSQLSLFKAEFKVMSELGHPNIAAVHDFESLRGSEDHFFAMEHVAGDTLLAATQDAPLTEIVRMLVDVCRALSFIHDHHIVHFDLKPGNVLVRSDGAVKVLDFGLVGAQARVKAHGIVGTPSYMAPELISGSDVDHRADLYSLGVMAYQLLCRRLPHQATDLMELYTLHCTQPVIFTAADEARVPAWLRAIVLKLCEKEPALRYRNANAVIQAVNRGGGTSYDLATRETRESYILSSRFTGRRAELDQLVEAALVRSQGRGEMRPAWFVAGHSGIGKSRLMRETRHALQLARLTFVESNFYEADGSEFGAIAPMLRHLVTLAESVNGGKLIQQFGPELVKLLPALGREREIASSPALPGARDEQLRLYEQLSEFILRLSELVPFVLYLNDLHWAPVGATNVLLYLIRRIVGSQELGRPIRVTVLGSYRSDEVAGSPLEALLQHLHGLSASRILPLEPLSAEQVSHLLCSMLGIEQLPDAFAARVWSETAGNPFFIEEVMRALVENGSVFLQDGAWAAVDEVDKLDIPAGVTAVFKQRVALLDPGHRAVLDALSVSAAPTSLDVLCAALGLDAVTAHTAVTELERRQMVTGQAAGGGTYRVSHDRMRETVYAVLADERRTTLHVELARALERAPDGTASDNAELLAYHYGRAGDLARAARAGRTAARRADGGQHFEHALGLYEQTASWLEALQAEPGSRGELLEVLLSASRLAEFLGQKDRQALLIARLIRLVERGGTDEERIRAYICQGGYALGLGRFAESETVLLESLALCRRDGRVELEREVLRSLAFAAWHMSDHARAAIYNEQIVALDQRLGDRRGYTVDLCHLATVLRGLGQLDRARALAEEALSVGRELGDPRLQTQTAMILVSIHVDRGDLLEKQRVWQSCDALFASFPAHNALRLASEASSLWHLGEVAECIATYERAIAAAREAQFLPELGRILRTLGEIYFADGNYGNAVRCFGECASLCARLGEADVEAEAWVRVAEIKEKSAPGACVISPWEKALSSARRGARRDLELKAIEGLARNLVGEAPEKAEEHYLCAVEIATALGERAKQADLLNSLGILAWKSRRYDLALERYTGSLRLLDERDTVHAGFLMNSIGVTLRSQGKVDEARGWFERAIAEARAAGERMVEGHALAQLGEIEVAGGRTEEAAAAYEQSLAIREAIGDRRGEGWMACRLAGVLAPADRAEALLTRAEQHATQLGDRELRRACEVLRASCLPRLST